MQKDESSFEWDNDSQLYYHASSGFYHDPCAGWYYSSKDSLYYKFENGNYVLLESDQGGENEAHQETPMVSDELIKDEPSDMGCLNSDESQNPPPPSEWLEETLIDLYLTGYAQSEPNPMGDSAVTLETDVGGSTLPQGAKADDVDEIEEGEIVPDPEDVQDAAESSGRVSDEGISWEEENWRAQYGQVVQSEEVHVPSFHVVDLWDWTMVSEIIKKKKHGRKKKYRVSRLVGKLVRPSTKLHPSMPSGGTTFRTAPICEVYLALVRVSSGQVYQLKTPSLKYLTSLSTFDSFDPTKDWGFPKLSLEEQDIQPPNVDDSNNIERLVDVPTFEDSPALIEQLGTSDKHKTHSYRDRAAERRALHGGFGVGPGQKNLGFVDERESPEPVSTEEAAAEALNMSFGAGSYARKLLENMGWKEGEALGNTMKGLKEPLQAVGNKGYAGLGWN